MSQLHYLTVQDVLWIHLQVTKKVETFQYAKLEEATFYQYAYGPAQGVFPQAGRFATGFAKMKPFEKGNAATAFVGTLAFLALNGQVASFEDAKAFDWFSSFSALDSGFVPAEGHGAVDPRQAIREVLNRFPATVALLAQQA